MDGKLPQSPVKPIGHGCRRIADTLLIHLLAGLVLSLLSPQPFGSRTRSFRGAKMLENAVRIAFPRANKNAVQFDDSKPELIHFGSHKAAPEQTAILPNNTVIKPKTCIRWLGVWLDRKLNFKVHVQTKIAAARRTLHSLFRLLNSEWGLKRYVY